MSDLGLVTSGGGSGGGLTDAQLRATPVPVSAAQSGTWTVNQGGSPWSVTFTNTTIAVTGTFWQATQPVSGTFWQATQPVSIAAAVTTQAATAEGKTLTYVPVAQGAAGTTILAAASASNKHKVISCCLVIDAAGTIKFNDSGGDLTGPMAIAANAGFVLPASILPYLTTGAINRALNLISTGGKVSGIVTILTEP